MSEDKKLNAPSIPSKHARRKARWLLDDSELTLLGLPTFIWYVVFAYLPMFGIVIAFKNYRISNPRASFITNLFNSQWAGFGNFEYFMESNHFSLLMRNTILYNIVFIILGIVIPVSLALMISNIYSKRKSKVYQTMMFFPHFMSWVVVSYFVYAFLNPDRGLLNMALRSFGLDPVRWYSTPGPWPLILIVMQVWKSAGYSMVVYLASITGIDHSLYEAAVIDGASKWQQAQYITMPSLKPIIIMMFILSIGKVFYSDFGLFYQVTQGLPNSLFNVASTFDTYIFNAVTNGAPIGRTAAASFFQSIACCVTILTANFIVSKIDSDSAII